MDTSTINQTVEFDGVTPHEVYEAIMDEAKHAVFTNSEAKISREVDGEIQAYNGSLTGKNLKLIPDQKIIQEWRGNEQGWPEDHFSTLTIDLTPTDNGTKLMLNQEGVPTELLKNYDSGWEEYYWKPMKAYFAKENQNG